MAAYKTLNTLALANFALPGEAGFPLNAVYERPRDRQDAGMQTPLWFQ
jgi:actin related protein 2/3 complex subunit 3